MQKARLTEAGARKPAGNSNLGISLPHTSSFLNSTAGTAPVWKAAMVFCCLVIKNPSLLKPQRHFNTAGDSSPGAWAHVQNQPELAGDTTAHTNVPRDATGNYLDTVTSTGRVVAQGMVTALRWHEYNKQHVPQSKERENENWPTIQSLTVCFQCFSRQNMWALSVQYQCNDILVLGNLLG